MIANLTRGKDFSGLIDYLFRQGKGAVVVGGNVAGKTPAELKREFACLRSANRRVKTPVVHCSFSLPPGETLTPARWNLVAAAVLAKLGLDGNRPWVLTEHHDTPHCHAHLMTSRIAYDGSVWYGHWSVNNLLRAKLEVEQEFGLRATPVSRELPKPTRGKLWELTRKMDAGTELNLTSRTDLILSIEEAVAGCNGDIDAFTQELKKSGVETKLNQSKTTRRIAGASFRAAGGVDWLKGSQLGKAYTWKRISERITAKAEQAPHPSIKNETERTAPGILDPGTAAQGNPHLQGGASSASEKFIHGDVDADQRDVVRTSVTARDEAIQFGDCADFSPIGPVTSDRNAAAAGDDASGADRSHASNNSRPSIVEPATSGLAALELVRSLFHATLYAIERLFPKYRSPFSAWFDDETSPNPVLAEKQPKTKSAPSL